MQEYCKYKIFKNHIIKDMYKNQQKELTFEGGNVTSVSRSNVICGGRTLPS